MRTETANRILHTARTLLAEHAAGKGLPAITVDWANSVIRANAASSLGHHSPARAFSGVDIDAVHRNPRWAT